MEVYKGGNDRRGWLLESPFCIRAEERAKLPTLVPAHSPTWLLFHVLNISIAMTSFTDRPIKKLVLFDVDGTLTPARQVRSFFSTRGRQSASDVALGSLQRNARSLERAQEESRRWICGRFRPHEDI